MKELKCDCGKIQNFDDVEWKIGHYQGMKTKTIKCECGKTWNFSVNVNGKTPPMFKFVETLVGDG